MIQVLPETCLRPDSVCLNSRHSRRFTSKYVLINRKFAYKVDFREDVPEDRMEISLNIKCALFAMEACQMVKVQPFEPNGGYELSEIKLVIQAHTQTRAEIIADELEDEIKRMKLLVNHSSYINLKYRGISLEIKVFLVDCLDYGLIVDQTVLNFEKGVAQKIELIDDGKDLSKLFQSSFKSNVKQLKVGGHHSQLQLIERRVFATRMLHPKMVRLLGLKHIKGMLLYGPPGTGKTLIARQISKLLKVKPKIVNGPEIMSQFVGKSEEAVRSLFADAKRQQNEKGLKSQLHCIIFDEIDALCKKRGSQGTHDACDKVVAQLLTQIDGIQQLNNILVIGITNRKDLIDQALVRPGRLDVHIEIHIPNQEGRLQILNIHTELMQKNNFLERSVNLKEIARLANNYTGAQLEGVVKSAQSFALERWKRNQEAEGNMEQCKIIQEDFYKGLQQVIPEFGRDNRMMEGLLPKKKIHIDKYQNIHNHIIQAINNLGNGKHAFLIKGEVGIGKTVMAAQCAIDIKYPFTKVVSSDRLLGMNEAQAMSQIAKIFEDSEKCTKSCIILDDLLRLIDYVALGTRYSTNILNLLINCIKKRLSPDKKQVIIATVGNQKVFKDLGFSKYFKSTYTMDELEGHEIYSTLKDCGFEQTSLRELTLAVPKGTLSRLMDTTMIQGTTNIDSWLRCWRQSAQVMQQ